MRFFDLKKEFPFLVACPAILWQVIFLIIPMAALFFVSVYDSSKKGFLGIFTLEHYKNLLIFPFMKAVFNSCFLASLTVILCLLISFPVANYISFRIGRFKTLALVLLMLPSWTNFIVRIYSWFFLLEKDGFLSTSLQYLGLLDQPHLLGNFVAVLIGMVYCYFPFMVIPIYSSLAGIGKNLIEAAADLGATRFQTFKTVIFPLALPGIYAGSLLIFLSSIGEFAVPEILGGAKYAYWGNVVGDQLLALRDFKSGAALTFIGLIGAAMVAALVFAVIKGIKAINFLYRRAFDVYFNVGLRK
ncbi:ABC transporter permease [Candidatus Dependentiae bacterium]